MTASGAGREWILAIDDDPWALEVTSVTLGEHDWHVQRAMSGLEAAGIISRLGPPSLVLVDAMMPTEDGFAVCRRLRRAESLRDVPIVFVTANDDETIREQALEAGANDFLTKPVAPSLLTTRVRTLIELHRHRSANDARTRYGMILETIGEGVLTLDAGDRVIEANRAAIALLGLPRDLMTPIHLPSHIARHWTVLSGQIGRNHDARLLFRSRVGAATTAVDWTSRPLPGEGDEAWSVVVRDSTDLWERDQALSRMMKSLGHKLRTPLTGLSVSLELAREYQVDPVGAEMIETARRSATRLQDTIIRMLEYVATAGSPVQTTSPPHPQTTPDDLIAEFGKDGEVSVTTSLGRSVRIDVGLVLRAVKELVANARAAGAERIAIHVAPHPDRSVQFEITDDGPGIPAAAEDRVFEPFYQLDLTGEQPGAGLGLSIIKADIFRAGGSVGTWSSPEGGTTAWFRLPDHSGSSSDQMNDPEPANPGLPPAITRPRV